MCSLDHECTHTHTIGGKGSTNSMQILGRVASKNEASWRLELWRFRSWQLQSPVKSMEVLTPQIYSTSLSCAGSMKTMQSAGILCLPVCQIGISAENVWNIESQARVRMRGMLVAGIAQVPILSLEMHGWNQSVNCCNDFFFLQDTRFLGWWATGGRQWAGLISYHL